MSVKRRLTGYSGMRVDWPHIRSIESSISFDFDSVLRGMVTGLDSPYLVRGFEIQIPDAAVNANSLQIEVADTAVLHSTAGESGTIFTIPNGTPSDALNNSNSRVVGSFQSGVPNYVSVELVRVTDPDSADQTAGWSEAQKTEFQRTVPIGTMLDYRYIITTSGFSTNLPLYIIGVSSTGAVDYIQNSRTNLFRLGKGGTVPDPYSTFDFGGTGNAQSPTSPRREWINQNTTINPNPVVVTPGDDIAAFRYGDFSITSLKEWMDAIMTRIKEITGSSYWYTDSTLLGDSINTFDLWWDSVGSVMTGAGQISYNLIMEITSLSSGALQTSFTDSNVLPGDSYIEGAISGNKATLQAFNNNQLVINSLIREEFVYDEELRNRRIWRPNASIFEIDDDSDPNAGERYGVVKRVSTASLSGPFSISSWAFTGNIITINTASSHGYEVGDYALIENLEHTAIPAELNKLLPNGVHLVKQITSPTQFQFTAQFTPLGTPSTGGAPKTSKDSSDFHPFMPRFAVENWDVVGSEVFFTIPGHSFKAGDDIVISGTTAATNAPNGRFLGISVEPDLKIKVDVTGVEPTVPSITGNEICRADKYEFLLTVGGTQPDTYEVNNIVATAWSDAQLSYLIGPDTLPSQPTASGAIILDGVVASTTVANPVKVLRVDNDGSGNLLISTSAAHGLSTNAGPLTYTIYGDQSLSTYIRTYENMGINTINKSIVGIVKGGLKAKSTLSITNNTLDGGETVEINTVDFTETTNWAVGVDADATAVNIAAAINASVDISIAGIVTATPIGSTVEIEADLEGVSGNSIMSIVTNEGVTTNLQFSSTTLTGGYSFLEVTTTTPHGFFVGNEIEVTGNAEVAFNSTFTLDSILSATSFRLNFGGNGTQTSQLGGSVENNSQFQLVPIAPDGTLITPPPFSYVNPGNEDTYARFPDNPYPGPIQWNKDIFVKGIVGDRYFRVPQTALATGTALANRFNINGLTGTAFLQDGEVAYINLERGGLTSNGDSYEMSGSFTIIGATPPVDEAGSPLVSGDFVRFESDSEARWLRIAGTYGVPVLTNTFILESDNGQPPTQDQRPAATGRLIYAKTTYDEVIVKPHWEVTPSPDIYWLAVRRDNGSAKSKIYFKGLELEQGETREINDNELSNHLIYTGAKTEAAINPNYTVIDSTGNYGPSQSLVVGSNIEDIDVKTKQITFNEGPELGFEAEDKLTFTHPVSSLPITYIINFLISSRTVVVKEDISDLTLSQDVLFIRDNYKIEDADNLTLAVRKSDRESARINTSLERPVYDESVFPVQINLSGVGVVKSGSFIYQGPEANPTALAWVLHGSDGVTEKIESFDKNMPGGHPSIGSNAILVHVYSGPFLDTTSIFQNGSNTGRSVDNAGNPDFGSPELAGGSNGIELVLPPNRRTKVEGTAIVTFPSNSIYKASVEDGLAGEELMVISNDSIREANVDYEETFGGPKAKIKILRTMPPSTKLRFRVMAAFGSALAKLAGNVTLQLAYDGGRIISTISGTPVDIRAGDAVTGGSALVTRGSVEINGQGSSSTDIVGGIFGPRTPINQDQAFLIGRENNKPKESWKGEDYVKSHSGYTGSAWVRKTGAGTSTGSSSFPLVSTGLSTAVKVETGKSARIKMNATARRTDGDLGIASFEIEGTFYNDGTLKAAGSPTTTHLGGAGDGDFYAVSFGIIGDDVVLVVFGTNGSTIQWVVGMDYQILEDSL